MDGQGERGEPSNGGPRFALVLPYLLDKRQIGKGEGGGGSHGRIPSVGVRAQSRSQAGLSPASLPPQPPHDGTSSDCVKC